MNLAGLGATAAELRPVRFCTSSRLHAGVGGRGAATCGQTSRRRHLGHRVLSVSATQAPASTNGKSTGVDDERRKGSVVALNNLCVDIMVEMDVLPGAGAAAKRATLLQLQGSPPPDTSAWEVGGASNFAIAAARLGVDCTCLGHLGRDSYGDFMRETMAAEGVHVQELSTRPTAETLVCWVLVDPQHQHSFCSRFDFTSEPLLYGMAAIPPAASATIHAAAALVVNGFVFDELDPTAVMQIVHDARAAHTPVFFDVGPRGKPLMADVPKQGAEALKLLLTHSDVLLLTEEEAAMVTGHSDPRKAADSLLTAPGSLVRWVVLKVGKDGCFVATRDG